MGTHPTVTKSEMSELLDSLTVVTGGNFPAAYVRREVMGVARKALAMHHAEITTLRSQLAEAKADNARLREALEVIAKAGDFWRGWEHRAYALKMLTPEATQ